MQSPKKGTVKKSAKKLDKYIADSPNIITENRKAAKAAGYKKGGMIRTKKK